VLQVYGAVNDNWPTLEPYFNETGSNGPSTLPLWQQRELCELAVGSVTALGFTTVGGAGGRVWVWVWVWPAEQAAGWALLLLENGLAESGHCSPGVAEMQRCTMPAVELCELAVGSVTALGSTTVGAEWARLVRVGSG